MMQIRDVRCEAAPLPTPDTLKSSGPPVSCMGALAGKHETADPKRIIAVYLVLVFALSSIFWYCIAVRPSWAIDSGLLKYATIPLMWCPAFAAIATRLAFQRNLEGFG